MKVVIIGAGIGGLTLAAALKQKAPQVEVALYERDSGPSARTQGYALGLKGDGGLPVLEQLGLREKVVAGEALKVTNFVFTDQAGRTLLALPAKDEQHITYRIQRSFLKATLLAALGATPVHYGRTCTGYELTAGEPVAVFADGKKVAADCVVGCDGVASALRQQMIGDEKRYLGLAAIVGQAPIEVEHPLLDGGYFMTLGNNGGSVFAYRQPGGVHFSYTSHVIDEAALAALPPADLLAKVREETQAWHPLVRKLAAAARPESMLVRGYYDKEPTTKVRDGSVWLMGDAAHPMCPFQGQGANMAMMDALALATYLGNGSAAGATELEADIVRRGRKAVLDSRRAAAQFHQTSALMRFNRNLGLRMANFFIGMFTRAG